ncbi:MAG: substrate-binding domain-containing protein [Treponema sp.]|nr:substrate-binding domain-containing protein [Treponema sp.]
MEMMNVGGAKRHQFLKNRANPLTFGFAAAADFSSFIGQEYVAGIMQATQDYGIHFINMADAVRHDLLSDVHFLPQFKEKTKFMRAPLLDGLITWASSLSEYMNAEEIQSLFASLAPLPMVDIGYIDIQGVPNIRIDNNQSMELIVRHLVYEHGFSNIAFIGTRFSQPHAKRLEFFKKQMTRLELPCDAIYLADSLETNDISAQVEKMLSQNEKIQAVVTSSDIIAGHVIEALEKNGISVPNDVAVTGFNNQLVGITASVPITTIDLAYFDRGYEAVELLIDRITQIAETQENRLVKTSLIIRQSCGCFEDAVINAMQDEIPLPVAEKQTPAEDADESAIRRYVQDVAEHIFPDEPKEFHRTLGDAVLHDLWQTNDSAKAKEILALFRTLVRRREIIQHHRQHYEEQISAFRRSMIPLVRHHSERRERLENICNALRVLHTLSLRYKMVALHDNAQNNMTNFALNLAGIKTVRQLENVLRFKLSELGIPGIIVALSPYLTEQLSPAEVQIVIPDLPDDMVKMLPYKVREPQLLPKILFPRGKRFSATLELLFHNGTYIGYAYLFTGNQNLAIYGNIKELLSQTLYKLYVQEGKTKPHALVITDRTRLAESIPIPLQTEPTKPGKLQAQDIIDYLIDHLDEMCDLEKMAASLQMSKSHLTRRVKALTGYSVQVLHELLKIEQAKDLIKSGKLRMNDIAARLGYTNPNYFSNVFKKVTGLSPVAWASRNRR